MSNKFVARKGIISLNDSIIQGNLEVEGDLGVTGNVNVEGDLGVTGNVNVEGDLGVTGNVSVDGDLGVTGNVSVDGDLGVTGNVNVDGDLGVTGNFNIEGPTGSIVVDNLYIEFNNTARIKSPTGPSGSPGLQYLDDYSDYFEDNSLVTKKFVVDGYVAINQQDGIISVDNANGNDATGQPYRLDLPFKTIGAAAIASIDGDIIKVRPGIYPEWGINVPNGVTVTGEGPFNNTFVGSLAATDNIFNIGKDVTIQDMSIYMPSAGHIGINYEPPLGSLTTDRSNVYAINFIGDEASGTGIGMFKGGTLGRLIGSDINCSTGGFSCIGKGTTGVMTLDNLRFPTSTGNIDCLFSAEAGNQVPRLQISGLNCGSPNINYVIKCSSSIDPVLNSAAPIVVMFNTNCVNANNFALVESDGSFLGVYGGKINTVTNDFVLGNSLIGENSAGTKTTLQVTAAHQAKYSFPFAALASDLGLSFFSEKTDQGIEGALINLGADFVVGAPEIGSDSYIGKGRPYTNGMFVLSTDSTASPSSNGGNLTNITGAANNLEGATFTFQGTGTGHSILFTTPRREVTGEYVKFFGIKMFQLTGVLDGSYTFEIQTATDTWQEIKIQAVDTTRGYRYADDVFLRSNSIENIVFGIDDTTTWPVTTISGIPGRWSRVRITSAPTSLPVFNQIRLVPSLTSFSKEGYRNAYGLGKWKRSVSVAGSVFSESGSVTDSAVTLGTGVGTSWSQPLRDSALTSTALALGSQIVIPNGICTAFPFFINVYYIPYRTTNGTGTVTSPLVGRFEAIVMESTNTLVTDPAGGIVPVNRTLANTETLTSKPGTVYSKNLTENGDIITGSGTGGGTEIRSVQFGPFYIDDYFEGDLLFFRFGPSSMGTLNSGAQAVYMVGIDIEGIAFSDGKPQ
jgi:cytoskeletal protein CcmA (bactofilin family)